MEMQKFGDWDVVIRMARNLPQDVAMANRVSLQQIALMAESLALKFIRDQSLNWKPLSKKYMDRKAREGLSNKIYVATSTMFQNITSYADSQIAFAGVNRKAKYANGESVANIAKIMEYGSIGRNIPPRKLWRVVYADVVKFIRKDKTFSKNVVIMVQRRTGKGTGTFSGSPTFAGSGFGGPTFGGFGGNTKRF